MKKQSQTGIAHLGLLLLLAVVVVIALIGYKVANNSKTASTPSTTVTSQAQTIKSKADLTSAETTLNQSNLDSDLNPASLDSDVNSLL
jgi:cytochrome b561